MKRLPAALILTFSLLLAPLAAADNIYKRATNGEADTLDPHLISASAEAPIVIELFEGLTTVDAFGNTIPGTAESWTISEDGLTYTFTLREGLVWSDGTPLTSQDHAWSLRRFLNPEIPNPLADTLYVIKNARAVNTSVMPLEELGISAPDPRTLVIELEHPAPYFLDLFLVRGLPVPRHVVEAYGSSWTQAGNMVSNGAFVLTERVPQAYVKLEPNPLFRERESVTLDGVMFVPNEDLATGVNLFRAGQLDMALNFPQGMYQTLKEDYPDSVKTSPFPGFDFYAINTSKPPFDDVRVRRALSIAIDRNVLTTNVMVTGETPAHQVVAPGTPNYPNPVRADYADMPMPARIAEARSLLADAGFDRSNPLTLELKYNTRDDTKKVATVVAAMWRAIGVRAQLFNADARVHRADLVSGEFDVARWLGFAPFDDPVGFLQQFVSDAGGGTNVSRYNNPAFDALIAEAKITADPEKRAALLVQAEQMILTDLPIIPLYYIASKRLLAERVRGWEPNRNDIHLVRYISLED